MKNTTAPPPAKNEPSRSSLDDRQRVLHARSYAWRLLGMVLEEHEYRSTTMTWPPEEHLAVMAELGKIRDTLFVVPGSLK